MKTPKVIVIHGYRKSFSKEEQIEIANLLKPILDMGRRKLVNELKKD